MKTAIVTGANGFVGRWLVKELIQNDVTVFAVVRNEKSNTFDIKKLPGVEIIYCDMNMLKYLPEKIAFKNIDCFYHLAWTGSTGDARRDYHLQLTNVKWTLDACNMAKMLNCKRFIGAGTLAELDVNAYTPVDGSTPNDVSNYGVAKIAAHYMSKAECCKLQIEHIWALLPNIYGVGNRTANFVNFASKTMLTGKPANFTAGVQPYDFVYISDVARALYLLGERGHANNSYYIGSTEPAALKEFIYKIRNAIDPTIQLNLGVIPFNGVAQPIETFNCNKLIKHTGYYPKISFDDGIKITVKWLRKEIQEGKI